jgi:hypothetical protein
MPWLYLNCGDPTLCDPTVQNFLKTYDDMNREEQLPLDTAIFSRHESRGDLHCELIIYCNPDATAVAKAVGAKTYNKPLPHGISPLIKAD